MAAEPIVPLATRLGIRDGSSVVILHLPRNLVLDLPPGVGVARRTRAHCDVAVAFFISRVVLENRLDQLGAMIFPSGALWIAWPKRSSRAATDITDRELRELAPPRGLVDNKVCALDETWTGLRLVWRRQARKAQG